ncbi:hypothetical protein VNO78_02029 [Psophocarpus tetragonolobus]|uniref:Uncharacterized protein n=1 Tax=Psophocarpus tetragonolobus TaxID=3891 RepID=A0AAN9T0Z5_PSOTE
MILLRVGGNLVAVGINNGVLGLKFRKLTRFQNSSLPKEFESFAVKNVFLWCGRPFTTYLSDIRNTTNGQKSYVTGYLCQNKILLMAKLFVKYYIVRHLLVIQVTQHVCCFSH